ncbi:hypothetical protein ACFZCG_36945 [Streptomyces tanashiensis]|uniref:hypothetical protein n=1 Tax=Streptomyces tanashiensis TaxID=67367 RepID=UPI0036EB6B9D
MVIAEEVTASARLTAGMDDWLDDAVGYVLDRATELPVSAGPRAAAPVPQVLRDVAATLTSDNAGMAMPRLHQWVMSLGASVPDNRCEAEKWLIDPDGRLRKTGHLTHAYRRDNELLTPLLDLAGLVIAFDTNLKAVAAAVDRCRPGAESSLPALATALLCYGIARGEQLPRTYNPERAAEAAKEAHRLQVTMTDAALVLQEALSIPVTGRRPVLHRWAQPPAALVQPVLPFHGRPARETPPARADEVEDTVATWANGRFEPIRADGVLLLAPVGPASAWRHAGVALGDLAARLPHPHMLAWCGVPLVQLREEREKC